MTVLETIRRSTDFLTQKGVESPRLQTELLLAHVLKVPRMQLYLDFERLLSTEEIDGVRQLVQRRGRREPLQHVIGSTSFCGLEIAVNSNVLIPRPETELLAERGWQFLRGLVGPDLPPPAALDFGAGSGCLAIALARHCPAAKVHAVDVSGAALEVASQNAARLDVSDRVEFIESDGFSALPPDARFDLIISNPPYVPTGEIAGLEPEVRDYDPRVALDGGGDGLDFFRRLAAEAKAWLRPGGKMMAEFGDGQGGRAGQIFENQLWIVEALLEDYNQKQRMLIAHG